MDLFKDIAAQLTERERKTLAAFQEAGKQGTPLEAPFNVLPSGFLQLSLQHGETFGTLTFLGQKVADAAKKLAKAA